MSQMTNLPQVSLPTQTFVEDVKLVSQGHPFCRNCLVPLNAVFIGHGRLTSNVSRTYHHLLSRTSTMYVSVCCVYVCLLACSPETVVSKMRVYSNVV